MLRVSRRGGFSDRNGISPENTEIQLRDFDKRTRVQFANLIVQLYGTIYGDAHYTHDDKQELFKYVYGEVYTQTIDVSRYYSEQTFFKNINETLMNDNYDAVLTLIETFAQYWYQYLGKYSTYSEYRKQRNELHDRFNHIFKKEYVGYRLINGKISPISDEMEVTSIKNALCSKYESVREHIAKANTLLADRDNPDYENSIKESISAVEAICEIFTELKGKEATLGNMLKKLENKGVVIHGGLKTAFNVLYGYTSDANGIRHAGDIGGPASTFEEAKFMLVSCSAFVNYLIGVWSATTK
ncbi:MAG: hypothetical protein IJE23_08095 [Tyzzerella sp.]|nr:hypothetical protein [Tyzzerella sp.]